MLLPFCLIFQDCCFNLVESKMSDAVISSWAAHVPKGPWRDQAAAWSAAKSDGWDGRQMANRRKPNFLIGSSQVRAFQKFNRIFLYGRCFYGANKPAAAAALLGIDTTNNQGNGEVSHRNDRKQKNALRDGKVLTDKPQHQNWLERKKKKKAGL